MRMYLDEMLHLFCKSRYIQVEFPRPKVEVTPVQGLLMTSVGFEQIFPCGTEGYFMFFGIFLGDKMSPEKLIKVQVQEGAVHIKQDKLNII
jgi:hypothetical protein